MNNFRFHLAIVEVLKCKAHTLISPITFVTWFAKQGCEMVLQTLLLHSLQSPNPHTLDGFYSLNNHIKKSHKDDIMFWPPGCT